MSRKTPEKSPEEMSSTLFFLTFTSLLAAIAARQANVSWQQSNPRRRKGPLKGPSGLQAGNRRKVRPEILHHVDGWQGCPGISLRGMGADRSQTGGALEFQSFEEAVSDRDQLLRSGGGDGRTGSPADPPVAARVGTTEG